MFRRRQQNGPVILSGPCDSCTKKHGQSRVIPGSAGRSVLCDDCYASRKDRAAANMRRTRQQYTDSEVSEPAVAPGITPEAVLSDVTLHDLDDDGLNDESV